MKLRTLFCIMVLAFILPSLASAEISSNTRLLQHPEWDGAVVSNPWLGGELRFQKLDDADYWILGPTFAVNLPRFPNLELGTRFWFFNANYDDFEDESGLGDADLWAKYQFINSGDLLVSGGLLLTMPFGDDGIMHPRATGEFNIELFTAARYTVSDAMAVIGHMGIRKNNDMAVEFERNGRDFKGKLDGETQFSIGGGLVYQLDPYLNVLAEFNLATRAYDEFDSDIELTTGIEYAIQPGMAVKGGIGVGFDDGAPDFEFITGAHLLF